MHNLRNCWMVVLVATWLAAAAYTQDSSEAQSDTILFRSWRDGEYSLYLREVDAATADVKISDDAASDLAGVWSPDGRRIAFLRGYPFTGQVTPGNPPTPPPPFSICIIHVMDADGSNLTEVTPGGLLCWSPDGTKIAFTYYGRLQTVNVDGTDLSTVVEDPDPRHAPAWSPDGTRIAFAARDNEKKSDLYLVNADGTNLRRLTNLDCVLHPTWSPDGATIALIKRRPGVTGIYVIDPDAGPAECIAELKPNAGLDWSSDGTKIAFSASDGLYTVRPDGTDLVKLLDKREIWTVDWSPDSKRIAFDVAKEGLLDVESIYIINADGTDLIKLTHSNLDGDPQWAPRVPQADN